MTKHAYLIIAHNEFYILEKLLKLLDNENNDIYIHIDKKVENFNQSFFESIINKSKVFFVKSINVTWGGFSMVQCELLLLEEASKKGYSYYHLISGVDLPLKSSKEIYDFFEENNGKEFIGFANNNCTDRVKYYHFFVEKSKKNMFAKIFHHILIVFQKIICINRIKKLNIEIKKGAQWFSITDELVKYILSKKDFIMKVFKNTFIADEIFLQTLVYNSKFKIKIYKDYEGKTNNLRAIDWKRGNPYIYQAEDFETLMKSNMLFARKFSTNTKGQKCIVDKIYNNIKQRNT